MINKKKYIFFSLKKMYLLLFIFILFITIGYSALNTELNIAGVATVEGFAIDIDFTNCSLISTENGGYEEYNCSIGENFFIAGVTLPNLDSTVTYELTITNFVNIALVLRKIANRTFNNSNMEYVLTNLEVKDMIPGISNTTFEITFKYKDEVTSLPSKQTLGCQLEFLYDKQVSTLTRASTEDYNTPYFNSLVLKKEIESISFINGIDPPYDAIDSFDLSNNSDGTVIGWYTDSDSNGLYEFYIGGINGVEANSNTSYLFYDLINLKEIDLTYFYITSSSVFTRMFGNCSSLVSLDVTSFNTSNAKNMAFMFSGMTCLTEIDLSSFDTRNVENMRNMFENCTSLVSLDISNFDTKNVTLMRNMFQNVSSLTSLDLSHFNTEEVTNMAYMFNGMTNLVSIDISNFDTKKVENMRNLFAANSSIVNIDMSSFETPILTVLSAIFQDCDSLQILDLRLADFSNATSFNNIFKNVNSISTVYVNQINYNILQSWSSVPNIVKNSLIVVS